MFWQFQGECLFLRVQAHEFALAVKVVSPALIEQSTEFLLREFRTRSGRKNVRNSVIGSANILNALKQYRGLCKTLQLPLFFRRGFFFS